MSHPLIELVGHNLLVRAGIGTAGIVIFLGVASGAIPLKCWMNGAACAPAVTKTVANTPQQTAVIADPAKQPAAADKQAAVAIVTSQKANPTLTSNDVVSKSFAELKVEMKAPTAPMKSTAVPSTHVAGTPANGHVNVNSETGLATRTVHVIAVKPDGTPDASAFLTQGYAAWAPPDQMSAASAAVNAAMAEAAGRTPAKAEEIAEIAPEPTSKPVVKPSASAANLATISGNGANVRSAPSKGNNRVLFALAGGEKVSIGESRNGWLRITDDQGRTGWVYKDYVRR